MNIDTLALNAELGLSPRTAQRRGNLGQDDFLRLMTEQLKNQDPLKPLASNEFMGQLAQFSTVQGIQSLNDRFAALAASMQNEQAIQAAGLVGQRVLTLSDRFEMAEPPGMSGALEVPVPGRVTLEIADPSGNVVHRLDLDAQAPGRLPFAWDGLDAEGNPYPPGRYTIAARVGAGGGAQAIQTAIHARVQSVSLSGQGVVLDLAGIGPALLSSVLGIG